MKIIKLVIVASWIFSSCQTISTDSSEQQLLLDSLTSGKFIEGYSDFGTELTFNPKGTFEHTKYMYSDYINPKEPSGWLTTITGTYQIDSNQIKLFPEVFMGKEDWGDSIALTDSGKYFESDSTWIRTSFRLIQWTGNFYLLSEEPVFHFGYRRDNDFVHFADNYNSGSEPRWPASYFAKRNNKTKTEELDLSQVPTNWRPYFIDSVAFVVVKNIEENFLYDSMFNKNIHRYILEGGTKNQVREGMTFYGLDGCCTIKIMESSDSTSKGIIELCPNQQNSCAIGDTLTTWNQRDYGKYVPQQ